MDGFRKAIGKRSHFISWTLKDKVFGIAELGVGRRYKREGTCVSKGTKARKQGIFGGK